MSSGERGDRHIFAPDPWMDDELGCGKSLVGVVVEQRAHEGLCLRRDTLPFVIIKPGGATGEVER